MQHTLSQARRARDAYLRTPHARGTSDVAVPLARPDRWPHPPRPLAPAAACPRRLVTTKISRRFAAARTLMARGPAQRGSSLGNAQEPRASTHGTTRHTLAGMWPCSSPYSLSLSLSQSCHNKSQYTWMGGTFTHMQMAVPLDSACCKPKRAPPHAHNTPTRGTHRWAKHGSQHKQQHTHARTTQRGGGSEGTC